MHVCHPDSQATCYNCHHEAKRTDLGSKRLRADEGTFRHGAKTDTGQAAHRQIQRNSGANAYFIAERAAVANLGAQRTAYGRPAVPQVINLGNQRREATGAAAAG